MAQAGLSVLYASASPPAPHFRDGAVYTQTGVLLFDPISSDRVRATTIGTQGKADGRMVLETASTVLTLKDALRARRAISRAIKTLRSRQDVAL